MQRSCPCTDFATRAPDAHCPQNLSLKGMLSSIALGGTKKRKVEEQLVPCSTPVFAGCSLVFWQRSHAQLAAKRVQQLGGTVEQAVAWSTTHVVCSDRLQAQAATCLLQDYRANRPLQLFFVTQSWVTQSILQHGRQREADYAPLGLPDARSLSRLSASPSGAPEPPATPPLQPEPAATGAVAVSATSEAAGPAGAVEAAGAELAAGAAVTAVPRVPQRGPTLTREEAAGRPFLTMLTYNLCCGIDEHEAPDTWHGRMRAVSRVVAVECNYPDFITLQEMSPASLAFFRAAPWWGRYHCTAAPGDRKAANGGGASASPQGCFTLVLAKRSSVEVVSVDSPLHVFSRSKCGRDLPSISGRVSGTSIRFSGAHLDWYQSSKAEQQDIRQAQMAEMLGVAGAQPEPNQFLGADAQWRNEYPHPTSLLPAQSGQIEDWYDLWAAGGPAGDAGYTFDCQRMRMHGGSGYQHRLDRILCKSPDWAAVEGAARLVGTQQVLGLDGRALVHRPYLEKLGRSVPRPVFPSDHFGVLAVFAKR